MNGLPLVLIGNDFPRTNFKKLGANRNNRLYRLLNLVKEVFAWFSGKPRFEMKVSHQADYKTN